MNFALYIDDVGSGKPGLLDTDFPYFGLGGILVDRQDEMPIKTLMRAFKHDWNIPEAVPFHGAEIRAMSKRYHWLNKLDKTKLIEFKIGLKNMVVSAPIVVHGCIVQRAGYYKRYHAVYGRNTWEMRKTAVAVILERALKFVLSRGGTTLEVYFEQCGRREDNTFRTSYEHYRTSGHPFDPATAHIYSPLLPANIQPVLAPIPHVRTKDSELLQMADLCLFYVAISRNGKANQLMDELRHENKLLDCLVANVAVEGIKFSCFDP